MILVISSAQDVHANAVITRLERRAPGLARLLDLSAFPARASLEIAFDGPDRILRYGDGEGVIDLDAVRAVWWRRPQPFGLENGMASQIDRQFAYAECHSAVAGLWRAMDAFWINHPTRDEDAARKVWQLRVAAELGLTIPRTCITNDPERARAFVAELGHERVVYKAFTGTEEAWRETRVLKREEVSLIDAVRFAPVIFQEYIPVAADLRVTMIDGEAYAGAIQTAGTSYEADFRMVMEETPILPYDLPDGVLDGLRRLMARFGLVYGAIDLRLTPGGEHVFLEVNPAGQWLFVEQASGLPISDALASALLAHHAEETARRRG